VVVVGKEKKKLTEKISPLDCRRRPIHLLKSRCAHKTLFHRLYRFFQACERERDHEAQGHG
jgi:hypothetical protein